MAAMAAVSSRAHLSVTTLHEALAKALKRQALAPPSGPIAPAKHCLLDGNRWVTRWVDYSNKYGLGYQLSDGCVGALFNDAAKMVLAPDNSTLEHRTSEGVVTRCTLAEYPPTLEKKVVLINFFRDYMQKHLDEVIEEDKENQGANGAVGGFDAAAYHFTNVRHWERTKHAIMFRLSTSIFQFNFADHQKLIISAAQPRVTASLVDEDGLINTYFLEDVEQMNDESAHKLVTRISYARECISFMSQSTKL